MNAALKLTFLILASTIFNIVESYVLVQVRKDENKSNVDALIHKIVPPYKFEEIANTARKQFKNFKQFKIKSQPNDNDLESIVFAIKTDNNQGNDEFRRKTDENRGNDGFRRKTENRDSERRNVESDEGNVFAHFVDKFVDIFNKGLKDDIPRYRAKLQKYNIKPEIVHFKNSNGKPSVMLEVDTKSILRNIREFLSSPKFKKYTDKLVNKAAVIYRTLKEEIEEA